MSAGRAAAAAALVALALTGGRPGAGEAWAGGPASVRATIAVPSRAGWAEVQLIVAAGDVPWRGRIEVTGGGTKLHVLLSLAAHGQRVLAVPFWVEPSGGAVRVWADGQPVANVATRILAGDPPGILVGEPETLRAWPQTWRAYRAFDLALLPSDPRTVLPSVQERALEQWVRWGGVLGRPVPSGPAQARVTAIGHGATVVAASPSDVVAGFERWRAGPGHANLLPAQLMERWERAMLRPPARRVEGRPGTVVGITVATYLAVLGLVAGAGLVAPTVRRASVPLVVLIAGVGSLATWGMAKAGPAGDLDLDQVVVVYARTDGGPSHVSALVRARAERRATTRFVTVLDDTVLLEVDAGGGQPDLHRALQWDADLGTWDRAWALGETAVLRVDGLGPDLGVRVRARAGGWQAVNEGRYTLRRLIGVDGSGRARALPDLGPGGTIDVPGAAGPEGRMPTDGGPAIWPSLMPDPASWAGGGALLAALDRPFTAVSVAGDARATSVTYVVIGLPAVTAR